MGLKIKVNPLDSIMRTSCCFWNGNKNCSLWNLKRTAFDLGLPNHVLFFSDSNYLQNLWDTENEIRKTETNDLLAAVCFVSDYWIHEFYRRLNLLKYYHIFYYRWLKRQYWKSYKCFSGNFLLGWFIYLILNTQGDRGEIFASSLTSS